MAHLKIERRERGDVAILDLDGKLTLGENSAALRESIRSLLADGRKQILVNLEGVDYMDSSGLGDLVVGFATAKKQGAELKLANLTLRVEGLLQLTKLLTVFETYESEEKALASFEASRTTTGSV